MVQLRHWLYLFSPHRVYGLSGSSYSGQFHRGERHGHGLLRSAEGDQYEGSWLMGRREGEWRGVAGVRRGA